jgi:PAS domain-containing protein
MAAGSQRQPLCIELWSACAMVLLQNTHVLPFTPSNDLMTIVEWLERYDAQFLDGLEEISETYGAVQSARSSEYCHSISCTGEIPHLTEFIESILEISNGTYTLKSPEFGSVTHLLFRYIDPAMSEIRALDRSICAGALSRAYIICVIFAVVSICTLLLAVAFDRYFCIIARERLRTALALVRHVPPPWISQTRPLVSFFLPQPPEEAPDSQSIAQLVASALATPTLCLGEGLIVEWMNPAFEHAFDLPPASVIGRPFDTIVPRANRPRLETWGHDEGRLYDGLTQLAMGSVEELHCNTKLITSGKNVPVALTSFSVAGGGVVVFITNRTEAEIADVNLAEAKRRVEVLQRQLVPRELAKMPTGPFTVAHCTLLGVAIDGVADIVSHDFREFGPILAVVEAAVRKNPPFTMLRPVGGQLFAAGGLFLGENANLIEHALPALTLARTLTSSLKDKLPRRDGRRFSVALEIGGPILCELKDDVFEVSGVGFGSLVELMLRAPPDCVLVSDMFRRAVADIEEAHFTPGPLIVGGETHVLVIRV